MKTEPVRMRGKGTAKELAKKYGVCERTIRNMIAERKDDWLERAKQRKLKVFDLRFNHRKSFAEIAPLVGTTTGGAARIFQYAKREFAPDFPARKKCLSSNLPKNHREH